MNTIPFLFVYGSLRKGFQSNAYNYISEYFELVGDATVQGLLYDLGNYPVAVPTPMPNQIIGELYHLKNVEEHDWAFGQLDDYEGVLVEVDEQQMYRRSAVKVNHNGAVTMAWIYWYNATVTNKPIIESGDVLAYLKSKL